MRNPKSTSSIPLSELIEILTEDLTQSILKRPKDWRPTFRIAEATIDASVTFERNLEAGGKITVWVAELGPKAAEKSSSAHRISLKLVPAGEGMTVEVAQKDPLIRGAAAKRTNARSRRT